MTFVLWVTLTFSLMRRGTGLFWVTYPSWRVILRFWKIPHNEGEALRIDGVDWQYGRDRAPQESLMFMLIKKRTKKIYKPVYQIYIFYKAKQT